MCTDHESRDRRLELVGRLATGHRSQSTPDSEGALARAAVRRNIGLARRHGRGIAGRIAGNVVDRFVHETDGTVTHQDLHTASVATAGSHPDVLNTLQGAPLGSGRSQAGTAVGSGGNRHGTVVGVTASPAFARQRIRRRRHEAVRGVFPVDNTSLASSRSRSRCHILSTSQDIVDVARVAEIALSHRDGVARSIQKISF